MLHFVVGRSLNSEEKSELEQRLERRLGTVVCVRHPPAIDDVRVGGDLAEPTILVSACCELTSRRAKILITKLLEEFASMGGQTHGSS
jgi:hypothetical protein